MLFLFSYFYFFPSLLTFRTSFSWWKMYSNKTWKIKKTKRLAELLLKCVKIHYWRYFTPESFFFLLFIHFLLSNMLMCTPYLCKILPLCIFRQVEFCNVYKWSIRLWQHGSLKKNNKEKVSMRVLFLWNSLHKNCFA